MNNGVSMRGRKRYEETRYMCSTDDLNQRIKNIVLIYRILNSDMDDVTKSKELVKIVRDPEIFKRKYGVLLRNGDPDKRLDGVRLYLYNLNNLYDEFKRLEETGYVDGFNYLNDKKDYFENYEYAKDVITLYLETEDAHDFNKFLTKLNLTQKEFKYCVSIIEELDSELYKAFIERQEYNDENKNTLYSKTISDLSTGIKTGELPDGTKFDKLEFLKRIPFKNGCTGMFMHNISNFLFNYNPEDRDTIMNYIRDNDMNAPAYFKTLFVNQIYGAKTTINGREITKEDNDDIFSYIELNDIPCIWHAYKTVREKLINGEITHEMVEELKQNKRPLLIKKLKMDIK
jgi:hypothetical protein